MYINKFVGTDRQESRVGKHVWSVARLFELSKNFPVMDIPLNHLCVYNTYERLSLRDMVKHMRAVNDADLNYPIIMDEDGDIMDGRHRLMKAMLLGISSIRAVRFEENPSPCRVED